MRYYLGKKIRHLPKRLQLLVLIVLTALVIGAVISQYIYHRDLRPVSSIQKSQIVTIASGASLKQIANLLKEHKLIRSAWAFELYTHAHSLSSSLQAGTYALSPSQTTGQIITIITQGKVASKLVTIIPGLRLDQIKNDLINDGFSPASVTAALKPAQYANLPVMAFKPKNVNTLEGLLWPDSFEKTATTNPAYIISESLNEMGQHLTPSVQQALAKEGLTTYQGLILASIVESEVSKPADQAQVAQVFLSRLKNNMPLDSDVTAFYGAILANQPPSVSYNSPYNTYLHTGLPPTPISTITQQALTAVTHPANTNWLYFVTGDNGTTYYSTNLAQHQQQVSQYCHKLCAQ